MTFRPLVVIPLGLGIAAIEIGAISLVDGLEPVLSIAEIACGVTILLIFARAALRR